MFRRNPRVSLAFMVALFALPAFAQTADHEQHRPTAAAAGPANPAPQQGAPAVAPGIGGTPMTVINNTFNPTGPTGTGTFNPTAEFIVRVNDGCSVQRSMSSAPARHVEGRIAFLKTELKITDAQMPLWNAVADALRDDARSMATMSGDMSGMTAHTKALPERLAAREKVMAAHLEAMRTLKAAVGPLYAALTDEQKKLADELMIDMGGGAMGEGAMGEGHGKAH